MSSKEGLETNFYNKNNDNGTIPISDDIINYKMDKKIGEGRFSKVYLAIHKLTSEKVAIKIIYKNNDSSKDLLQRIKSEMEILKKVKHNNICKLFSIIETEQRIYIIQEYIEGIDLLSFIKQAEKLGIKLKRIIYYFRQIVSAINYLHNVHKISHRDLKPENILIDNNHDIKLIDFGLSKIFKNKENKIIKLKTHCGSPFYASPEMIKGEKYYGNISDIWSLGVILYFMIFDELPFYESDLGRLYKKILEEKYTIPKDKIKLVGKDAIDLIKKMLEKDPKKRIKINEIMEHNFFKKENNVLCIGINLNEIVIPVDEDILDEIYDKFGYDKENIRISILKNIYDYGRSLYLILLQKKIKSGIKSIADLKSDLYIDYIKNENNKMKKYESKIENVIKERVKNNKNQNENLLINHDGEKDNEYNNNEKDSSSNKKLNLQIEENQNKIHKRRNKSQINIYEPEKIKRILTNENSNKYTNNKSNIQNKMSQKIIKGEKNIKKFKTLFHKKNESLIIKSNIVTQTFKTNKIKNKNIKIIRQIQTKEISNNKEKILFKAKKLQKNKTYFNSRTEIKSENNNNFNKIVNTKTKKEENPNNLSQLDKSKQIKENKYIKIKKEIRKHFSLTPNKNKTLDISENKNKEQRFFSHTNNNSINKDNSYINKTINSNLTRHKNQMIRDLLLKKSYNNNIKKLKKDFLKSNEKTLKKEEDKKYNNLTYLKASTNFNKTVINVNDKISTSNIKHQRGKKIKLIISENNFHKNKFKDKNKMNHNKIRTTKNSQTKIIKTNNNSNNNKYINLTNENSIINKYKPKKIMIKKDEKINNQKISIDNNNNKFEDPFDLNFIYFFEEKEKIKNLVEKDLKKKKIKFIEIEKGYEKNINYKCYKDSGLRFNININNLKSKTNVEQSKIFICKIKNGSMNINNDFLNFVNSFYRVYI